MKTTKLIILLAAATLLLAACARTSTSPVKEDAAKNSVPGDELATEATGPTEDLIIIENSKEDVAAECESNSDPIKQAECYWQTAFEKMDQSICDLIPTKSEEEIKTALKAAGQDYEDYYLHLTPQRCQSEFAYSYEDANWGIESGIPPWAEILLVYKGEATLNGWIEYTPAYVGEPEAHFHVADADIKKLPLSLQKRQNYLLLETGSDMKNWQRVSENVIKELESATESDPATIIVNRAAIAIEGSPALRLVEIVK